MSFAIQDAIADAAPRLRGIAKALDAWLGPLADLFARAVIFRIFFFSGAQKLENWEGTLQLFEHEYMVPVIPPTLAAHLATFNELVLPVLILFGLAARIAAIPLLGMTLVIQFVLGAANPAYDNLQHFLWMALLLLVIARGAGPLSLDHLIAKRFGG